MGEPQRDPLPLLLVDVANVVGSRPDGWWRDRVGATRRVLAALAPLTAEHQVIAVLEGAARAAAPAEETVSGIRVVHAAGSGDDALVGLAARGSTVVTADRGLRARVVGLGASVVGPGWLWSRLEG